MLIRTKIIGLWLKRNKVKECFNQFVNRNLERVVAIAPRREALETPIKDPERTEHNYGYRSYNTWTIEKKGVDNA